MTRNIGVRRVSDICVCHLTLHYKCRLTAQAQVCCVLVMHLITHTVWCVCEIL